MTLGGIDETRAQELIASGALAGIIGGEAKEIRSLTGGGGSPTFEVAGSGGRFIAKLVEPGKGAGRIEKERRMGEFLFSLGIMAPRITILETKEAVFGIYRRIEGEEFSGKLFNERFSDGDGKVFVDEVTGMLDRLHAVPLDKACTVLGLPAMTAEEAAREFRFGPWFDVPVIEAALAGDLQGDAELLTLD